MKILSFKVGIRNFFYLMKFFDCLFKFWTLPYGPKAQWSIFQMANFIGFKHSFLWWFNCSLVVWYDTNHIVPNSAVFASKLPFELPAKNIQQKAHVYIEVIMQNVPKTFPLHYQVSSYMNIKKLTYESVQSGH